MPTFCALFGVVDDEGEADPEADAAPETTEEVDDEEPVAAALDDVPEVAVGAEVDFDSDASVLLAAAVAVDEGVDEESGA